MKVLVFSDSHLTDQFDQRLYDYIVNLLKKADKVIINGDLWDAYLVTFDEFINSKWKKLFPLLKKKKCVYILGNHDKRKFMDERVSLISDEVVDSFEFIQKKTRFHIQHGHFIAPTYDRYRFLKNPNRVRNLYKIFRAHILPVFFVQLIYNYIEHKKGKSQFEKFVKDCLPKKTETDVFIFGHTHLHLKTPNGLIHNLGPLDSNNKHYMLIENGVVQAYPEYSILEIF